MESKYEYITIALDAEKDRDIIAYLAIHLEKRNRTEIIKRCIRACINLEIPANNADFK